MTHLPMRSTLLALACLLALPVLRAQEDPKPVKLPEDRTFAKLRGISYFFIDVAMRISPPLVDLPHLRSCVVWATAHR